MKSNYDFACLGAYCRKIGSGATPKGGKEVYLDEGEFALIRSQNVLMNEFSIDGLAFISPDAAEKLNNVAVEPGDVLLNITGDSVARCCSAPAEVLPARVNQHVAIIRPDPSELSPRFVQYFLVSPAQQDHMLKLAGAGATRNALTKGMIEDFLIPKPQIETQMSIAKILGDLDDKIDVLRQLNATLEEMARALFRAWFIDFLPVRAKAAGATSFHGMPQELFNVLPDSFEPSEIGEIPMGWATTPLDKIADFLNGLAMQKYRPTGEDEGLPVIKIAELRKGISNNTERASNTIPEKYKMQDGDLIFSWSGSLMAKFWTGGNGALNQHLFKVTSAGLPLSFIAHWIWHHLERFQRIAEAKATTMGHIKRGHLSEALVVLPPDALLHDLASPIDRMVQMLIANSLEQRNLAELRTTLLPKLISGVLEAPSLEALGISRTT